MRGIGICWTRRPYKKPKSTETKERFVDINSSLQLKCLIYLELNQKTETTFKTGLACLYVQKIQLLLNPKVQYHEDDFYRIPRTKHVEHFQKHKPFPPVRPALPINKSLQTAVHFLRTTIHAVIIKNNNNNNERRVCNIECIEI